MGTVSKFDRWRLEMIDKKKEEKKRIKQVMFVVGKPFNSFETLDKKKNERMDLPQFTLLMKYRKPLL